MATVYPTRAIASEGDGSVIAFTWALTTANSDGGGIPFVEWADATWTVTGTWGGATLKVQGSADNATWVTTGLSNAAGGTEATASADKVFTTIERPNFIRPNLTTVGVGASVTVTATLRRAQPLRS